MHMQYYTCRIKNLILLHAHECIHRSGKDWRKARSASNNQIKPSNVQTYTPGVSDVVASFIDYIQSARDGDGRISDITMPIRRLLTSSKNFLYLKTASPYHVERERETEAICRELTLQ